MQMISILIPTYNEVGNVVELSEAVKNEMKKLPAYAYEIVFIDNDFVYICTFHL